MATTRNCLLPDDLLYNVNNNQWLRDMGDGSFQLGMTDIAQSMAGTVIHCRAKKAGKAVRGGKSLATVESGKWVGPVKAPFDCKVVESNDAVTSDAKILNESPYKRGWIVRIEPLNTDDLAQLVNAQDAVPAFEAYMDENEFAACIHCEGWDGE